MPMKTDDLHDVLVMIPTMGDPSLVLPAVQRVLLHSGGHRIHLMLVVNPQHEHLPLSM